MGWEFDLAFKSYGSQWRGERRIFGQHFGPRAIAQYHPRITRDVRDLLARLLEHPAGFMDHIRQYVQLFLRPVFALTLIRSATGSLILSVTYGIDSLPKDDPYLSSAEAALHGLAVCASASGFLGG